jgi:hypothetical protein
MSKDSKDILTPRTKDFPSYCYHEYKEGDLWLEQHLNNVIKTLYQPKPESLILFKIMPRKLRTV